MGLMRSGSCFALCLQETSSDLAGCQTYGWFDPGVYIQSGYYCNSRHLGSDEDAEGIMGKSNLLGEISNAHQLDSSIQPQSYCQEVYF